MTSLQCLGGSQTGDTNPIILQLEVNKIVSVQLEAGEEVVQIMCAPLSLAFSSSSQINVYKWGVQLAFGRI